MPANGALLRIGYRSPGSQIGRCGSQIADSLRQIFEIFPFSGDSGRRPGSIGTAWRARQCARLKCLETDGRGSIRRGRSRRPAMRAAQERISARTLKELGPTFKTLRQEIAAGLAQSLEGGQGRAVKNVRALARAVRASARARRGKPSRPHSAETKAKMSAAMKKSKAAAPG